MTAQPSGVGGYSYFDLYLMGLIPPEEAPDTFFVANPDPPGPEYGLPIPFTGTKKIVSLRQFIAAEGPRLPDVRTSQKSFRVAFILLKRKMSPPTDQELARLKRVRADWELGFAEATGNRASVTASPLLQVTSSNLLYAFTSNVSDRRVSSGTGVRVQVGYVVIKPGKQDVSPAAAAIFSLRQNDILVSEVGVLPSIPTTSARIFSQADSTINTGVAIANPGETAATVNLSLVGSDGAVNVARATRTVEARTQVAQFVTELFQGIPTDFIGSLNVSSNLPVAITALRSRTNQRREFLMTTIPTSDLNVRPGTARLSFPLIADGGGYRTQIALMNTTTSELTGTLNFRRS